MYTTKQNIENYLGITLDTGSTLMISSYIACAERFINNYTGNTFGDVIETRYTDFGAEAEIPTGLLNGVNLIFGLSYAPVNTKTVQVVIDGVMQYYGIDYTVSGKTITFTYAPASGSTIFCYYNKNFDVVGTEEGATTETTRYFDLCGNREVLIDTFNSITTLEVLDLYGVLQYTLVEDTDFVTYPYNENNKYKIILKLGSQIACFPRGERRLKVKGVFGVLSVNGRVPEDIEMVATMLVSDMISKSNNINANGKLKSESLGDYSITYDDTSRTMTEFLAGELTVVNILNKYRIMLL